MPLVFKNSITSISNLPTIIFVFVNFLLSNSFSILAISKTTPFLKEFYQKIAIKRGLYFTDTLTCIKAGF
jgi:hypothetical protein